MSSGGKKRVAGLTVERRVFYTVKHSIGPLTGPEVRTRSGLEYWAVIQALGRLVKHGYIRKLGAGRKSRYERIPGKRAPADGRGKHPNSRDNLLFGNPHTAAAIGLVKRGHHPRAVATTAIEQCWGWLPPPKVPFSEVASVSTTCWNSGGTVRPQET